MTAKSLDAAHLERAALDALRAVDEVLEATPAWDGRTTQPQLEAAVGIGYALLAIAERVRDLTQEIAVRATE